MNAFKIILTLILSGFILNTFSDSLKVYIEYEYLPKTSDGKITIKLYKDGDKYKLWRKLSDSPDETAVKSTYIDINANSVVRIIEKDGVKKGMKSTWDNSYSVLVLEYLILFRGLLEGGSFEYFTKETGSEVILGKKCIVYESGLALIGATTKYYLWNDIMLKADAPDYTISAVQINETPMFSDDEFTVPPDVEWK